MESSSSRGAAATSTATTKTINILASHFGDHSGGGAKDLDGLMAINDTALSEQIEFILQDDMPTAEAAATTTVTTNNNSTTAIQYNNPPNTIATSASESHSTAMAAATQQQLLNSRRIIIQSTALAQQQQQQQQQQQLQQQLQEEEADPELNDENLQDIEEEAQDAEADADADEEPLQLHTHIKVERPEVINEEEMEPENMEFISTPPAIAHHSSQTSQLVIPAGSTLLSTNGRTLTTVPVSEAIAQLHRRPVYISSAVGGMAGATFVRMPAVISRSPMAVLNVVQQSVGASTAQLILQATPVSAVSSAAAVTPVVVTSSTAAVPIAAAASNASGASAAAELTNSNDASSSTSNNHTSNPTTSTTYQCLDCVEKFDSKELFDIHRSGHANNMKCAICNMVLKSLKNYEKHCLRCKPYECQICGRVVRFRPNFIKHMRVHTGQQSERHKYKCDVCHKEFMSFEYFKVHKKIHNENVNLTCEICGKVFSALASLRGHSKLHSGVKLHKCDVCGKGFGQRYNLKIHARTHSGDFPFECKICKKKLHTQSSLQTHMNVHQRDQQQQQALACVGKPEQQPNNATPKNTTTIVNGAANHKLIPTSTIIKLEPQSSDDMPSTSSGGIQIPHAVADMHDDDDIDENSSDYVNLPANHLVSTSLQVAAANAAEDSSNASSNASQQLQQQQQLVRTIVIKNYMQNESTHTAQQVIQQQQLRKTPIIHSTGGVNSLSAAFASVVKQTRNSPSLSPSSSSTSCSSSVVVTKTGAPLTLASAAIGTSTIRSTRNHIQQQQQLLSSKQQRGNKLTQQQHHRNQNQQQHHRHRHANLIDDDDEDAMDDNDIDDNDDDNEDNADDVDHALPQHIQPHHMHHIVANGHHHNHRHFDDDDDDEEKSSPSLATAAIIKIEPNLYSSGSGDNSNEMLIKEEIMFEDSAAPQSPQSPPSSKYRISNFESDLVDHHVDLNHSLPPYGNLFEPHSMPDSIPTQLYADDDDFRLDHNSLGALHNTSSSNTDGDYNIKKEWSSAYGASSSYAINGKFDDDSDALCDAANFIYN